MLSGRKSSKAIAPCLSGILALGLLANLATRPVQAQVLYGSVVGVVEDPSGATVPNVQITLTNKATGQIYNETSDGAGRYSIINVSPGAYDLKASANGFRTQTRTDVVVTANEVARVPFKLEVGSLSEQVTVAADATQLQTDKADTHSNSVPRR